MNQIADRYKSESQPIWGICIFNKESIGNHIINNSTSDLPMLK